MAADKDVLVDGQQEQVQQEQVQQEQQKPKRKYTKRKTDQQQMSQQEQQDDEYEVEDQRSTIIDMFNQMKQENLQKDEKINKLQEFMEKQEKEIAQGKKSDLVRRELSDISQEKQETLLKKLEKYDVETATELITFLKENQPEVVTQKTHPTFAKHGRVGPSTAKSEEGQQIRDAIKNAAPADIATLMRLGGLQ